jgi:hypothetical protein
MGITEEIRKLREVQSKLWDRTEFPDGGSYEEMYEAYRNAFEDLDTIFNKALELLECSVQPTTTEA